MTEQAMVRVAVGFNGEYEQEFAYECSPGDTDDNADAYEFEVSADLWAAVSEAEQAYTKALSAVVDATDYDRENFRLRAACTSWRGYVSEGREWWAVVMPASGDENTWPLHNVVVRHLNSEAEAQALIDSLPEFLLAWPGIGAAVPLTRDKLFIEHSGPYPASTSSCYRCGWPRDEHADAGEVAA